MMLLNYKSKKELKAAIGQPLRYTETSLFGPQFKPDGTFYGAHRPLVDGSKGREFFAQVTMAKGVIAAVK